MFKQLLAALPLSLAVFAAPALSQGAPAEARAAPRMEIQKTGEGRVDLNVERADIQRVLWELADVAGINLVIDDEVRGPITMRLRDVAWADAFEAVLKSNDLGAEITGDIVRVAPMAELSAEMRRRADFEEAWQTVAPMEVRIVPIDYADPEEMLPMVEQLLSPRGSVTYDERTRSLIIRDVRGSQALGF